jgi:hypothetical protein
MYALPNAVVQKSVESNGLGAYCLECKARISHLYDEISSPSLYEYSHVCDRSKRTNIEVEMFSKVRTHAKHSKSKSHMKTMCLG